MPGHDRLADLLAHFLFCQSQLILLLQIEPECGVHSKPVPEPERRVGRDRPPAMQNLGDPVRWYMQSPRELSGTDLQVVKFVCQDFSRVNGWAAQ